MRGVQIIFAAVCALAGHGLGQAPVVVELHADAEVRGVRVELRDLATVEVADAGVKARLLALDFGRPPALGFQRVLSQRDVLLRLTRAGHAAGEVSFRGSRQAVLHPRATQITVEELRAAAEPVVRAAVAADGARDFEIEPSSRLRPLTAPSGRYGMDLRCRLAAGGVSHSSVTVEVQVLVDDEEYRVVRLPYRVRRFHEVLVTRQALRRGQALGDGVVELQRRPLEAGASPFLVALAEVAGLVAARDLRNGQALAARDVMQPAVVLEGDLVQLVASNRGVQVATQAVALDDGAVGARVPVRNVATRKVVQAVVRSAGLVVVPAAAHRRSR